MELIINLPTKVNENGFLVSWALFLCPYCLQEVEKSLSNGLKQKSCGCQKSKLISEIHKGKQGFWKGKKRELFTEEHIKNLSLALSGENNPMYGKKFTKEQRQNISNSLKGLLVGEKNGNWQGGISFEPYGIEFNKDLKQQVLERDTYICQSPNCEHKTNKLDIHHIDYNKQNNNLNNLITLCRSCHSMTNGNRLYWTKFYQNIMLTY